PRDLDQAGEAGKPDPPRQRCPEVEARKRLASAGKARRAEERERTRRKVGCGARRQCGEVAGDETGIHLAAAEALVPREGAEEGEVGHRTGDLGRVERGGELRK